MKIMYIITKSDHGGAQKHVLDLVSQLEENESVIISGNEGYLTDNCRSLGKKTYILNGLDNSLNPIKDISLIINMVRLIRFENPDIIHLHSTKAGMLGRMAALLAKKPSIFTAHGWAFTEGAAIFRRIIGLLIEQLLLFITTHVVAVSKYDHDLAISKMLVPKHKISWIHNAVADSGYRKSHHDGDIIITMVARFSEPKDHLLLIKAFEGVKNAKMWFIGDGELLEDAKSYAKDLQLGDLIKFWGARDDVSELLSKSDIFTLISKYEGFPISILEALRTGLPVVASDVGGVSEAIVNDYNGYLVLKGDVLRLRIVLQALVDDERLRLRLGDSARKSYEENFTIDKMIIRMREIYNSILLRP